MSEHDTGDGRKTGDYHIAATSEIPEGERHVVEVEGREIAVFNVDGTYHALLNFCTHQSGPVCEGMIHGVMTLDDENELCYTDDGYLSCPWHGWTFDIETGKHTGGTDHHLVKYDTAVRDGEVYLVRGD
jgi:nitrite reductase (NADH) small subunit